MRLPRRRGPAIAIGLAAFLSGGAALAANAFDGTWSAQVVTEKGDCDRAYRYPSVVEKGRARYGGTESFAVSGSITPAGALRMSISRGQDRADASGSVEGKWGSGSWKTSGARSCSGTWTAEKRS